jgi:hypothetical protein
VIEVVKRYQKTDPALLLELSKIGNNLNQIARALNIIKNADPQEQRKLDIFSIFSVLKGIQTELEQVFPALPKISRQSPERLKKQLSSKYNWLRRTKVHIKFLNHGKGSCTRFSVCFR